MSLLMPMILAFAVWLAIPVCLLTVQVFAAILPPLRQTRPYAAFRDGAASNGLRTARVGIIVPAHNEGIGLLPTLRDLSPQTIGGDRILVIADNCTDNTAEIAASTGVEVIKRCDPAHVGKGYALAAGIAHFAIDPPDYVIFSDADCRISDGFIDRMTRACEMYLRPIQACYLMRRCDGAEDEQSLPEFAWYVKNYLRPLGMRNLGGPCQLMGSGMIFPWTVIQGVPLASGNLVEDLQLGLDLAQRGSPPLFMPSAVTTSEFPLSARGGDIQRQRWVQGHLATLGRQLPRLLAHGIRRLDLNVLALALDLSVPPILLLGVLLVVTWVAALACAAFGGTAVPLLLATANVALFGVVVILAGSKFSRGFWSTKFFSALMRQIWARLWGYSFLLRQQGATHWIRTERNVNQPSPASPSHLIAPDEPRSQSDNHTDVIEPT